MTIRHELALPGFLTSNDLRIFCGQTCDDWPLKLTQLHNDGLPKPDPILGRYYGPAIRAFFDRRHMLASPATFGKPDGEERD